MNQNDIKNILEKIKKDSFVSDYQASDAEAMGLLISKYFEWDGIQILEASANALEDANFHTECGLVRDMLAKVQAL